ncbi:signal transduction histidine kinase [Catenuloplanes nepalensis]|uniref:histidine kinase n=1 Tax=Catenuloplanes nepalensis TaxID=587533 RepID=A0ABT9MQA2_9ACTN|nr:histidine kinase [Catenuloplanes nepalensis]MDP9793604.1 signal transduction histidine kinase [Catenuloplanes nepalensis]
MISTRKRGRLGYRRGALLAVFGLAVLLDLFITAADADGVSGVLLLPSLVLGGAGTLIWARRHRPGSQLLPVFAIALSVASMMFTLAMLMVSGGSTGGGWGFAESGSLLLVLYVVARYGRPAVAWAAGMAVLFALLLQPQRIGFGIEMVIFGMLLVMAGGGVAAIGVWTRFTAGQRERQIATVRAEQRAEFARDLHDFIAHHVTGIVVQAQGARFIAEQDPQRVITALDQIEKAGAETMSAMRRMVGVLRGADAAAPLAPLAGVADLQPLLEQFSATGGAHARLFVEGTLDGLPVDVSTSAYRVVMEALTNVRRHAVAPTRADVQLRRTPDWLFVRVTNDGTAAPRATDRRGYGLDGLGERVASVGGWLRAGAGINGGWVVDAALPIAAGEGRQ